MVRPRRAIPLDGKIRHAEKWQTNVSWPAPIDERLSDLVDLAVEAGESDTLSRSEILAALVFAAEPSGLLLREQLSSFRTADVREALIRPPDGPNVIELRVRRPGRR